MSTFRCDFVHSPNTCILFNIYLDLDLKDNHWMNFTWLIEGGLFFKISPFCNEYLLKLPLNSWCNLYG